MAAPFDDATLDLCSKLRTTVEAFSATAFVVLDGGLFDDLPAVLKRERLFGRSLFLDRADDAIQAAGPWLVALGQSLDALATVLSLTGDLPAAVFWSCGGGEAVLYRHLRTLNMARIPVWAAQGRFASPAHHDIDDSETLEAVMFRHWDPRVLGGLMPVLDEAQFSRVLGPGEEIAFLATDHGGVRRVVADSTWLPAPTGLLIIRSDQVEALIDRRRDASHRRIAAYLRDVVPEKAGTLSDDDLLAVVRSSRETGVRVGLESEQAFGRWAYLVMASDGAVERLPEVHRYIANGAEHPDERLSALMNHAVRGAATSGDLR